MEIIIETYLLTGSNKQMARQLKISKDTVRGYVRKAQAEGKDLFQGLWLQPVLCALEKRNRQKGTGSSAVSNA